MLCSLQDITQVYKVTDSYYKLVYKPSDKFIDMFVRLSTLPDLHTPLSDQHEAMFINIRFPPRYLEPWMERQYYSHWST